MPRVLFAVVTVAIVLFGVWLTGAVLTEDAGVAMLLTGGWFAVSGAAALLVARRSRRLAAPVVGAWLITSAAAGGFLLWTSTIDRVVDEQVLSVPRGTESDAGQMAAGSDDDGASRGPGASDEPGATGEPGGAGVSGEPGESTAAEEAAAGRILLGDGRFRAAAHPTSGRAALIKDSDGSRVLTLTRFETDPGPDLRVYLVPGDGSSVRGSVDLGALKGNKGNQQYAVPTDAPAGAVVIWCRAFSVAFGSATLA
jgi:hypothetical protein